ELLARADRPTAIFAGADIAALGVLRAADEAGLSVPEDLSVAGYDNIGIASLKRISLTSVDQDGQVIGATAARLLVERIEGRTRSVTSSVSPTLIVRGTTGPPRP
ncbi:substrate-binding domain-containing protein, partial [Nonomuraea sp. NPDC050310]